MTNLLKLHKSDKIGVWTASDPIIHTQATQWISRGQKVLESMGFTIVTGTTLTTQTDYTAGTAELRWQDFLNFITDPDIKMILTALGGENAHQILPLMDFQLIAKHPKIIMGYSDPTVFLNPIFQLSKIPTFYGPHLASFDPQWPWFNNYDRDCFHRMFIQSEDFFEIPPSGPRECWNEGVCEGPLVGGCLTDLVKLLGTPWEPDWNGAILILETMKQTPQNIDVYITHLMQAGAFKNIAGLILGKFYNCNSERYNKPLKNIILDICGTRFPILKTVDFGHFSHFCPLPLGIKCRLNSKEKSLHILEPIFKKSQKEKYKVET